MRKDKLAFVCQRYGLEINGGSELYCRQLAEKLTAFYDIEVFTTCAIDYITWKNEYKPGTETIHGVKVHRFRVDQERNPPAFDRLSERVLGRADHSDREERAWIDAQGPVCSELLRVLSERHSEYKKVIFMTYLYYLTAKGLPMEFENALLIPTVHDEPPAYLRYYEDVFRGAKGFIWNTVEERDFANQRFPDIKNIPGIIAGIGVDVPSCDLPEIPEKLQETPYIIYAGRIDFGKNCDEMFRFFEQYKQQNRGALKLVLIGKAVMEIPKHPDIISLGFVSNEMKFSLLKEARALVLFSRFESLSMVVLESMTMGRPVLVNEACQVLRGHCVRSNAGLFFSSYPEFAGALNYLLTHPKEYEVMCRNGKKYVEENYQWERILDKIIGLIESR